MKTILIVEDLPVVRRAFKRALSKSGYDVKTANNAADGLKKLSMEKIDLVLTDVVMPGIIQGDEMAQTIRNDTEELPIIIISGFPRTVERISTMQDQYTKVLKKPIKMEELLEAIETLLD